MRLSKRERFLLAVLTLLLLWTGFYKFWIGATRSQTVKSLRTSNGFPLFGELVV